MKKILYISILCILSLQTKFIFSQNKHRIDSLANELNKAVIDTLKANLLNEIAWEYLDIEPNKTIEIARKAFLIADKENFVKGSAIAYNNIGNAYMNLGDYKHALIAFDSSLTLWNTIPNFPVSVFHKKTLGAIYNNKGVVYRNKGDYKKALKLYLNALEIDKELEDKSSEASTYNNIGIIYYYLGDLDKSVHYFEKSLALKTELKNYKAIPVSVNNIAAIYAANGEIEKSIQTYEKAIKLYEEQGLKAQKLISIGSIGAIYIQAEKYEEAKKYLNKSLSFAKEIGDQVSEVKNLNNIALLYSQINQSEKALSYLDEGEKIALALGSKELLKEVFNSYVSVYKSAGNYKKAYDNQLIYEKYKDSLLNENKINAIAELETKFETAQKEKDIIQLKADKQANEIELSLKEAEKKKQNIIILAISIVLVLILVFTFLIVKRLRISNAQKLIIEEKNKNITDSITYALRIQKALLSTDEHLYSQLKEHFIFFKPRDIVSGDFYWNFSADDIVYIACCDCTGHGVPGAFMSLLNITLLNETVVEKKVIRPDLVLNDVRENIIKALNPAGSDIESKDGMDAVFCKIDLKNNLLQAACANNPIWIVTSTKWEVGESIKAPLKSSEGDKYLYEIKADKMPVGSHHSTTTPFTLKEVKLQKGDCIYLITDGYVDQFGGKKGKKFKHKQLKKLLLANTDKSMEEQKKLLNETFENWKGDEEQVDDICIMGIKI